ncbi:hypothetical protein B0T24DRAFT_705950 [Lasiosphaeria ovina]|uniref:Uncharacterized protein n=1 Tax=Lasiosphaeria ovina TaxID=92902 RepID=A0AAE0K7S7_9PEZI|nr:hypothetical protein B0T24DRAFT_705950 [Lasiosphaeria ovina]
MTTLKTADELYNDFKGKELLQGWDMLVAYRQKEVNEMLALRHDEIVFKNPAWNSFSFEVSFDDPATHEKKAKNSVPQQVQLLFKCSGSWAVNQPGAVPWKFPEDCHIRCVTDLVHVVGDVGTGEMKPATSNQVGLKEDSTAGQSHVAINFPRCAAQFVNGKGESITTMNIGGGEITLRDFVSTWGFKYHLTGISTAAPDAATTNLIRKHFVMTLYVGSDAESSALLMWINLEGMTMAGRLPGKRPEIPGAPGQLPLQSRQPTLNFTMDGYNETFPLPKVHTAVVYISYDAIFVKLIKDHMAASGYTNIGVKADAEEPDGMVITARPPPTAVSWPAWAPDGNADKSGERHYDGYTFNLKDTTLTIEVNKKSPRLSLKHTVPNIKTWIVRWRRDEILAGDTAVVGDWYRHDEAGELAFDFGVVSDVAAIDYFFETNLLFPGQQCSSPTRSQPASTSRTTLSSRAT